MATVGHKGTLAEMFRIGAEAVTRAIVAMREHDFLSHVEDARKVLAFNTTTAVDHKST
ncbi:hypothetical protein J2W34_004337 [Variovorax boronicumulans]|uniref:hypothetical protein n=1 Tax=Variovorax boronicumulans TaxID=436515 RepID=UPI002783ACC0|nr:hypothetical protein [Variovorax boronicumulans]MDQ0072532.1 hypothetical protein [Variovorax boronicumulans]